MAIIERPRGPSVVADFRHSVRNLLHYRELLAELTRRDLRIRYTQAVMGVLWAILTPLVVALSGWIIRLGISYLSGYPLVKAELAGIAVKAVGWSFFVGALGFGTGSITANYPLVTKVYFPRQVLPFSAVATQIVDSAIGVAALAVLLPFFGVSPSLTLLWLPLLALLLILLTSAATLLASAANVFYRDARHLVQLITSFGIFFTPVIFSADAFGPSGARLMLLNPVGTVLEGMRLATIEGHNLTVPLTGNGGALAWSPWYLVWAGGCALLGVAIAAVVFYRTEHAFAEYV